MNISSSQIFPKPQRPKMVTVSPLDRTNGGPMYKVTVNTDIVAETVKDVGVTALKSVAGATSVAAHAPLTLIGPFVAPKDGSKGSHAFMETRISTGAGLVAGALTGVALGGLNSASLLIGSVAGGAIGLAGYLGALSLNDKQPFLLDKIAGSKAEAAYRTGGSPARKAGAAYRKAYQTGIRESWKNGVAGLEKTGYLLRDSALSVSDFADGFLHPQTNKS